MNKELQRFYKEKNAQQYAMMNFLDDKNRLLCSNAFRRLGCKTQVFTHSISDHFRTRLTHSMEVGLVARHVATELNLEADLAEIIALAHDIGHPPFGHLGEDVINSLTQEHGGFDHNLNALRIVHHLESGYKHFNGLNLTFASLEGIAKHNGPLSAEEIKKFELHVFKQSDFDLQLSINPSLEAQVASLADDIAYVVHDMDDGFRSGLLTIESLKPLLGDLLEDFDYTMTRDLSTKIQNIFLKDIVTSTKHNIKTAGLNPQDLQNPQAKQIVRENSNFIVGFSKDVDKLKDDLKEMLRNTVYKNHRVQRINNKLKIVLSELLQQFLDEPNLIPKDWYDKYLETDTEKERVVIDYVAGMTDRFVLREHKKIFYPYADINLFD